MLLEARVEFRWRCVDILKERGKSSCIGCSKFAQQEYVEHELFNEEGDHPRKRKVSSSGVD